MTGPDPKVDVEGMRKVAEAASKGPWAGRIVPERYPECDDADLPFIVFDADDQVVVYLPERYRGPANQHEVDGEFIATFDPPAVLAMLARIEELEGLLGPFAAYAKASNPRPNALIVGVSSFAHGEVNIHGHHFHAARAALSKPTQGDGE